MARPFLAAAELIHKSGRAIKVGNAEGPRLGLEEGQGKGTHSISMDFPKAS